MKQDLYPYICLGSDVLSASYRWISRPDGDDFHYTLSDPITVTEFAGFPVKEEFIVLTLNILSGESLREYLLQVLRRPELVTRTRANTNLNLSFTIIGIDTVSNAHAQRKLPKSFKYIKNELGGYVFMGHSIVGDGTTEQLAALLTGKGEQDNQESRRGEPGAKPIDEWNWVFKKAKGMFNYRPCLKCQNKHASLRFLKLTNKLDQSM